MGRLTGTFALMTAGARGPSLAAAAALAAATEAQPDDHYEPRGRRRHDRLIAFLGQRTPHSFMQSGQLRAPTGSNASDRPHPRIH